MAEAFGLAAGALGLIGAIDASMSIGGKVLEYVKDFRDEEDEHRRLVSELNVLQSMLPLLRKRAEDAKSSDNAAFKAAVKDLEVKGGPLDQYRSSVERIGAELEKIRAGSTNFHSTPPGSSSSSAQLPVYPKQSLWKKVTFQKSKVQASASSRPVPSQATTLPTLRQRLAWPSTLKDIKNDLERIGRFQSTVILILTAGAPAAKYIFPNNFRDYEPTSSQRDC